MPIVLQWRDGDRRIVERVGVYVPAAAAYRESGFPLLSGIEPAGDTVFNWVQLRLMATELEGLRAYDLEQEEEASRSELERQIQARDPGPGTFLWFLGD